MVKGGHPHPEGVYAALATPRKADSIEADAGALFDYLDVIVEAGVDGLVLFGSTGEFVHFDAAERMRVLALAIRRSRVPVLVNVSHSTLAGAVSLADNALGAGAAGVLLMPPYFYRYGDEQLFKFYQDFAKLMGGSASIYLYNLPLFTNSISGALAERLLGSGAFAGIKDSSGEWQVFEALNALRSRVQFTLLVGNESLYLRARLAGADGVVSGIAAAIPELLVAIHRAVGANDLERARHLNLRLEEFMVWVNNFPATTAIKQAAVSRGWKLGHFALPPDQSTWSNLLMFQQWFQDWLPIVLGECSQTAMRA